MQFFNLFSFVVAASYAAALPQPAELSGKHSNNADTNLAFGLEARSYQPVLNSQRDSATLVLLKRQDDSEGSPEDGSEESTGDDSEESTGDDDEFEHTELDLDNPLNNATFDTLLLVSKIEEAGDYPAEVPESKDSGENLDIVIKSGLGDEEYANVESSLKEANEKLKADASGYMKEVTDAVSAIGETPGSVKPEMETIQTSLGRTLDAYKVYFEVLQPQLTKFNAGENIDKYLSEASENLVGFTEKQQGLYDGILQKLETAPSE
ncbi:hypothetical protein BASA81_009701 [Batrachochytrium salamandrivorans]|nr:hypothetical protein BASA81_009701 [Batrachochytrium salamandrivorans]